MIINYFCWSTLISLIAMILLYPLRHHSHGARVSRVCAAIFLFPSLVSSIASLILILKREAVLVSITRIPMIKIHLGVLLSESNIIIITCINLSIAFFIFLLSNRNFIEFFLTSSLAMLLIFVTAATPDQIVRSSVFSLGIILINCLIIYEDTDRSAIKYFTTDVMLNRISDLLALVALIQVPFAVGYFVVREPILNTNYIGLAPNLLFFISIFIRILSLHVIGGLSPAPSFTSVKFLIFPRMFVGVGSPILLLFFIAPEINDSWLLKLFFITSLILFIYSLISFIVNVKKIFLPINLIGFLSSTSLLLIYTDYKIFTLAIIGGTIICYQVISLSFITGYSNLSDTQYYKSPVLVKILNSLHGWLIVYPNRMLFLISNFFINFVSLIYSGFLLYRLPQLILTAIQIPFRFLNNGSIQRSLIFVAIMLIVYSYWWRKL